MYGTIEGANALFAADEEWQKLTSTDHQNALDIAILWMDQIPKWKGRIAEIDQSNAWPRQCVFDKEGRKIDGEVTPDPIIKAQYLLAKLEAVDKSVTAAMAEPERLTESESVKAGPVNTSEDYKGFMHNRSAVTTLSPFQHVNLLIAPYVDSAPLRLRRI